MLNAAATVPDEQLQVLEGIELHGRVNVDDYILFDNVRQSICRGHPQIRPQQPQPDRIVLVGGGPSLESTLPELRELVWQGAKLVTVNGAYHWCLERNLRPSTQIVMDARASNARFLEPAVPQCRYVLASQCHPTLWDAVDGRPDVWIFHAALGADGELKTLLDNYYLGQWVGVGGGTTVITRAISLLRMVGFLRFDLFGVDSCWMGDTHHAYAQAENANDKPMTFTVHPTGHPQAARKFVCSPWHVKQAEDFLQMIRVNGEHFLLNIHGDGLLAYAMQSSADVVIHEACGHEPRNRVV